MLSVTKDRVLVQDETMRGTLVRRTWVWDPGVYAPARHRRSCGYEAFMPEALADLRMQLPGDVAGVISDAEQAVADLNRARALACAEANQDAARRVGPEAVEILANIDAMQLAIERASTATPIRVADIVDIHTALLARGSTPGIAGRIRTSQKWIGGNDHNRCGADFVPPPPEEVERLLHDLALFCNEETLPPLVQAAVAHAQFETVHPFDDGNGRTGRTLVQIVLRRRGLAPAFVPPVSVILARAKDRYVEGLTLFREDRIAEWLETFAVATRQAADLAVQYAGRVAELQDRWRQQLRETSNPRAEAAAWAVIDILPAHPVVAVPVAVAATRRTKPAVTNAVAELERAGVLRRLTESARNRAWEAEGLLDLVVRLESGLN
jgi:Fic family protein